MTGSATFSQPNYPTQTGTAYPLAIDAAIAVLARLGGGFAVHEQSTPDMTVAVDAGWIPKAGALPTEVAAQNTGTITAPSGNPRYDIVYADALTGTIGVATGSEAASPSDPAVPAGKIALARLRLDNSPATTAIDNTLIDDLRTLGMFNTGTSAGNLVMLDASARLPALDGSLLTGISTVSESDMRLAFLRIAENAGDRLNMIDGIADPLSDETDIDTAASDGQNYNAAGDYYENVSDNDEGLGAVAKASQRAFGGGSGGSANIALQFTPSVTGSLGEATLVVASVTSSVTAHAELWTDNSGSPGTQVGSDSGSIALSSTGTKTFTFSSPPSVTGSTTYWLVIVDEGSGNIDVDTTANQGGFGSGNNATITSITDSGANSQPEEWKIGITVQTAGDAVVVSAAFTADSAPDTARLALQVKPVDSITVNTDLIGWASRVSIDFTTDYAADANQLDATAHGLSDDDRVFARSSGTLPAGLSAGVPYYVVNATTDALELSLTSGGAAVTLTDDGSGTHTLIAVTQATLSATETLEDGTTLYEDADLDISAQPSGTDMRWINQTDNTKEQQLHGAVFQWA